LSRGEETNKQKVNEKIWKGSPKSIKKLKDRKDVCRKCNPNESKKRGKNSLKNN
jgi:hypothetical protein